jgi:hypothetical protein
LPQTTATDPATVTIGGICCSVRACKAQHQALPRVIDSSRGFDEGAISGLSKDYDRPDRDLKIDGSLPILQASESPRSIVFLWSTSDEANQILPGVAAQAIVFARRKIFFGNSGRCRSTTGPGEHGRQLAFDVPVRQAAERIDLADERLRELLAPVFLPPVPYPGNDHEYPDDVLDRLPHFLAEHTLPVLMVLVLPGGERGR